MNKDKLVVGGILLTKSNSLISKIIRWFMVKYRKNLGLKSAEVYSHGGTIIDVWGELHIAEALAGGITITPVVEAYGKYDLSNLKFRAPRKPYSKTEQALVSQLAVQSASTRYDFFGLFWQIQRVSWAQNSTDPNWNGPTGSTAEKREYCTEFCATLANKVRPNTFKEPWAANPVDVDINQYYIDTDIS